MLGVSEDFLVCRHIGRIWLMLLNGIYFGAIAIQLDELDVNSKLYIQGLLLKVPRREEDGFQKVNKLS